MSETNREIRGIDKAGQKELWDRPLNPSQEVKHAPDQDTKAQTR